MNKVITTLVVAAAAAIASPAAASAPSGGSASIPFVNYGGIIGWTAKDDSTLYVESNADRWYEVDLAFPCTGLPFATRVGFDTGPADTFDRFSSVFVDGQRCPVQSISIMSSVPGSRQSEN